MISAERNFRYFQIQRRAVVASLAAAGILWASLILAFVSVSTPAFGVMWALHLVFQSAAVALVLQLLSLFVRAQRRVDAGIAALSFSLVALYVIGFGFLPIVSRDALIYHLEVPKLWLEAGRIVEIPWHEWSHFPLFLSIGYAGFEKYGLAQFTPLYHFTFLILAAGVAASFVYYKLQDEAYALLAALIVMSMPICMKLAAEPMSDLGLAFYFGLGFSLFVFWGEQRGSARILFAVGSALGFALGTKYNALLAMMMFLLCMVSFLQRWNFTLREVARSFGIVIGVAVILYLPWPIKNFWYTGNPFYPFAEGIFGVSDELPFFGSVRPIPYRMGVYREDWREIVLIPLRMMFTGLDDIPSQFDGLLSPILLCAFATLLSLRRKDGRSPWMMNTWLLVVSYHVLSLSLFYALVRYQAPLLVPIVSLCSCGLALIGGEPDTRRKRIVFRGVFAFQLLWAGWYGYRTAEKVQPFGYWLGNEARETFLQRRSDEYNTARFVNAALPDDAVVYLLFTGNRYYLYDRQVRGSYFSQQPIVRCLGEEATAEHLSSCLRAMGISHIALHTSRTRKSLDVSLSSEQKVAWTDFAKRFLELAYQDQHGAHTVWRLRVPENST